MNIDKSTNNYSKLINIIRMKLPNSKIYIESILQVDNNIIAEKYKTDKIYNFYINNDYVKAFNIKLQELALKSNITFINHITFDASTETVDGIHPSLKGYFILKEDLQQYINVKQ